MFSDDGLFCPHTQVRYDAVLEALVLTASGDEAKTAAEMNAKKNDETVFRLHTSTVEDLDIQAKVLLDEIVTIEDELMASG